MSHEPDDPKDDKTGEEAGHAVAAADHDGVAEYVVLELVVAGQGDHAAPGDAEREEDLDAGVRPHVDLQQLLPLWGEVERDPVHVAGKGGGTDQEDDEDAVGEEGGEVDQLAEGLDPLPQGAVDDCPSQEQAKSKLPTNGAKVVNSLGDVQHEVAAKRHF